MGMTDDSNTEILEGADTVATDTKSSLSTLSRLNDYNTVNSSNELFGGFDIHEANHLKVQQQAIFRFQLNVNLKETMICTNVLQVMTIQIKSIQQI